MWLLDLTLQQDGEGQQAQQAGEQAQQEGEGQQAQQAGEQARQAHEGGRDEGVGSEARTAAPSPLSSPSGEGDRYIGLPRARGPRPVIDASAQEPSPSAPTAASSPWVHIGSIPLGTQGGMVTLVIGRAEDGGQEGRGVEGGEAEGEARTGDAPS
jgi:hypothetical protein